MKHHHQHQTPHPHTLYQMRTHARLDEAGSPSRGGVIYHLEGATLQNVVFTDGVHSGTEQFFTAGCTQLNPTSPRYSDEQVARAIAALNGKEKPLGEKQLFLGIIKVLQSRWGWSPVVTECCRRINGLPGAGRWEVACNESNFKIPRAMRFAKQDYKIWDSYRPTAGEETIFMKTKQIADRFVEQLEAVQNAD